MANRTTTIKVNVKVIETEAFLAVLSETFEMPSHRVATAMKTANIASWEAFRNLVNNVAHDMMARLQSEEETDVPRT